MAFDLATAKPIEPSRFDLSTAKPIDAATAKSLVDQIPNNYAAQQPQTPIPDLRAALANSNPLTGMAEGGAGILSGMVATPLAGIAGLGAAAANYLGITNANPTDIINKVAGTLTYEPTSKLGKGVVNVAAYPFEKLAESAGRAGDKTFEATGSPVAATAVNTGIQALPLLLGRTARRMGPDTPEAVAARAKKQSLNAKTDAGLAKAKEAGYAVLPDEKNAGTVTNLAAGLSGEPKLAKVISKKNAEVTNNLIRKDVGLPEDAPISRTELARIRAEEGAAYDAVKNTGTVTADLKYAKDLSEITKSTDMASKSFSHRSENPFAKIMEGLNTKKFDAAAAVEEVKLLRADADKAYSQGDKQLGAAYKKASQALDDMLDRHLKKLAVSSDLSGNPEMANAVAQYQAARVRIAKTYAADKALNDSTGNIDASVYARELKNNRPLTGGARQVAEVAQQFPRSMQRVEKLGATGPTVFDALGAGLGKEWMLLGARPTARHLLASDFYQKRFINPPSYSGSDAMRLLGRPETGMAGMTLEQRQKNLMDLLNQGQQ